MSKESVMKSIAKFGYLFMACGIFGIYNFLIRFETTESSLIYELILCVPFVIYIPVAIGIFLKKRWGFGGLYLFLKISYYAYPVGTYLVKDTLEGIKNHNIRDEFK